LSKTATTEAFVKSTPDLRGHANDGPGGQKLDAYEWVLLIAANVTPSKSKK
jgi:hypothetical protein